MKGIKLIFLDELGVLNESEKPQVRGLTEIAKATTSNELQKLLLEHLDQSENHLEKLDQVYTAFEEAIAGQSCQITTVLLRAWSHMVVGFKDPSNAQVAVLLANLESTWLCEEVLDQEKSTNQALILLDHGITCDRYGRRISENLELIGICCSGPKSKKTQRDCRSAG